MKRGSIALVIALGCTSLATVATAAEPNNYQFKVAGAGNSSCGTWTADRQDRAAAVYNEEWVDGFVTGLAAASNDVSRTMSWPSAGALNPLNGTDPAGAWGWIDNYCYRFPLKTIMDATEAFIGAHPR